MSVGHSAIAYLHYLLTLATTYDHGGCLPVSVSEVDLECMATWKDLPDEQYMVARLRSLTGAMSTTESRYRCFVSTGDSWCHVDSYENPELYPPIERYLVIDI